MDKPLKVRDCVRLHPATDLFMRGVTYATITKIGSKWIHLHHYLSNTHHKVTKEFAKEYFLDKYT
jgi:hypothetical protein